MHSQDHVDDPFRAMFFFLKNLFGHTEQLVVLGSVWMFELEGMELNWVQYQISRGIEMRCDSNSIVWMSLHWRLES